MSRTALSPALKWWRHRDQYVPAGALLLDLYPGAVLAWSSQKIWSNYTGACWEIERDSGIPSTQDIGFVGREPDQAAIAAFCGTAIGSVRTVYGQNDSGPQLNLIQVNRVRQAVVYNGSSVEQLAGKPCKLFDGNDDEYVLDSSVLASNTAFTWFVIAQKDGNQDRTEFGTKIIGGSADMRLRLNSDTSQTVSVGGQFISPAFAVGTNQFCETVIFDGSLPTTDRIRIWSDGSEIPDSKVITVTQSLANNRITLGGRDNIEFWDGRIQDNICYLSNKEKDRAAIEAILMDYYS